MTEPELPGQARFWQLSVAGPFLLVALIWGSTWLVIKDQIGSVPPSWSVTWRFIVAAIGMGGLALFRRESLRISATGLKVAALLGLLQFVMNFQFVYRAETHLTSGIVAVFFALLVVPNALLAWIVLKQPVTRGFIGGSAVAGAGIALLLLHEYRMAPPEGQVLTGIALTAAGLFSASCANVLQATKVSRSVPMIPMLAWAMLIGAMIDGAFAWAVEGPPQFDMRPSYVLGVLYLSIVGSVITFPLYFRLIQRLGAGRGAYNGVLVPVIAMLLSTLFEGYRWSALAMAGSALAMLGLVLALKARNPSR
ncbi:MAG: EamA family transporter [Novosphingobium sp. 17-62-19]|uniref:DMT family transporter n=1 Tax=Novosphingobium sp. 17-62-19 TaxID=1970406 RepID=UPI000BCD6A3A|nr:EamA family transporter [Novosphingobium sp. 17-62-19]OYX96379.1 MAG: EamA family transporter [Novosphingobium sp. 35-62-5]OZA17064.1 MAG: EamA family transporter [Novosphingobium sp. 17-62-19]HQS95349.1 EamA family transporter [Novosphingobium sp.]